MWSAQGRNECLPSVFRLFPDDTIPTSTHSLTTQLHLSHFSFPIFHLSSFVIHSTITGADNLSLLFRIPTDFRLDSEVGSHLFSTMVSSKLYLRWYFPNDFRSIIDQIYFHFSWEHKYFPLSLVIIFSNSNIDSSEISSSDTLPNTCRCIIDHSFFPHNFFFKLNFFFQDFHTLNTINSSRTMRTRFML